MNFSAIDQQIPFILYGATVTLKFTLFSLLCGLPLGVILALFKIVNQSLLNSLATVYTSIFRGTPLLVQLGIIFYATPQLIGYRISAFEAGVLAFSLNSAAYTSEVIRAGIQSIDKGQWEACRVLGLSSFTTFRCVIFPQALRNILPALANEMANLLKESALVSTIGEADLLHRAKVVAAEKFLYFEPLIIAGFLYFIMVSIFVYCANKLEKKLSYA